jgi:hypothetical protein
VQRAGHMPGSSPFRNALAARRTAASAAGTPSHNSGMPACAACQRVLDYRLYIPGSFGKRMGRRGSGKWSRQMCIVRLRPGRP